MVWLQTRSAMIALRRIKIVSRPYQVGQWLSASKKFNSAGSRHTVVRKYSENKKEKSPGWTEWEGIWKKFVPVGICLIAVMQWRAYRRRQRGDTVAKQWEIKCYCWLPLRTLSRGWGYVADTRVPEFLRPAVYDLYIRAFGVNLSEAKCQNLKEYPTLVDFFTRSLKDGARKIDHHSCLVSPCDGTVLSVGTVHNGQVEQVKGVTYYVKDFLGEKIDNYKSINNKNSKDIHEHLLQNPHEGNTLFQCVIYLAPGDYHRFHSPADWKPIRRRHFSGELLSVNPRIAKWLPGLFVLNERAVYLGEWEHGFFSYTAVGATNVGSIKVNFDKTLHTNQKRKTHKFKEVCLGSGINLNKGDLIGEFRMGSTIVVIFEAPVNFKFNIAPGEKVLMGQTFGCVQNKKDNFVDRGSKRNISIGH